MKKSLFSASLSLALMSTPALADVCVAPGDIVLEDPAGDVTLDIVPAPVPSPVGDALDISSLSVAAPAAASIDEQTVVFTLTTGADNPLAFPPGSGFYSSFIDPRKTVRGVRMEGDMAGGLAFFSYTPSASQGGQVDGRFVEDGSQIPATGDYSGGVVTITVKAKDIGVRDAGDVLSGFNAGSVAFLGVTGVGAAAVTDKIPDDLGREASLSVTVGGCGKSAEARNAEGLPTKSASNFSGAFGLLNLLMLLPLALRRRIAG